MPIKDSNNKGNIFISLPYGMSIRNVLTEEFVANISRKYNIVLFSSVCSDQESCARIREMGVHETLEYKQSRLSSLLLSILSNAKTISMMKRKNMLSLQTIMNRIKFGCSNSVLDYYRFLTHPLLKVMALNPLLKLLSLLLYPVIALITIRYARLYFQYKPKIFFTAHPFASVDQGLEIWGRIFQVNTIASVHSWDNPTTKLSLHFKYDHIMVWNHVMKHEMIYLYGYSEASCSVIGVPQFDDYFNLAPLDKSQFFDKYGLSLSKKLVVFFAAHPDYVPHTEEIIDYLYGLVNDASLSSSLQLWVRLHPGTNAEYLRKYLGEDNIIIDTPSELYTANEVSSLSVSADEREIIANLLYHCDLVINCFSTTTLDALCFDKPVINLAIDNNKSARSLTHEVCKMDSYYYLWEHYLNIVRSGATEIVYDFSSIQFWIEKYISNSDLRKVNREKLFSSQIIYDDARSRERLTNVLLDFLKDI